MMRFLQVGSALLLTALIAGGCSANEESDEPSGELDQSTDDIRESVPGPFVKDTDAEVWAVQNQWADKTSPAAAKAGVAWPANSGLTWEEKYVKWIGGFEKIPGSRQDSFGGTIENTIRFTTPTGKKLDGPVLECADVGIWLRLSFAAFYHLPFYLAASRNGKAIYFGHFGVIDQSGDPVSGFPKFKTQYQDYESSWHEGQAWPSDAVLRKKHVGAGDDEKGTMAGDKALLEGDGAGAYFDEQFLNKRVGHMMVILDGYFGSGNLADGANMFHVKAEATSAGDALLERWQKNGIGHTLPVMTSKILPSGKMRLSTAAGSMPRRQPSWEEESTSAWLFKSDNCGGVGNNQEGVPYAKLGGGIRRWRTPVATSGRWSNIVPMADRPVYIADTDLDGISARPAKFAELLAEDTPEGARDAALAIVDAARTSLHDHPSSCSARSKREEGFIALYAAQEQLGVSKADTDKKYRMLDDYVFAELEYTKSKTCCWNGTTPAMRDIIMDFAQQEKQKNDLAAVCKQPTVFMATAGGKYDVWKAHANLIGRAADWKEWSEDEPCTQRDVAADTLTAVGATPMCQ